MPSEIRVPEGARVRFCPFGSDRVRRVLCLQGRTVPSRKGKVHEQGGLCPLMTKGKKKIVQIWCEGVTVIKNHVSVLKWRRERLC